MVINIRGGLDLKFPRDILIDAFPFHPFQEVVLNYNIFIAGSYQVIIKS